MVNILLDGKVVGDIWSEDEDGTKPYSDNGSGDWIQMCGIIKTHKWKHCGRFENTGDLDARFKRKEKKKEKCEHCGKLK